MYVCEALTREKIEQLWDEGVILEMYTESKPYISGGTFSYPYQRAIGISLTDLHETSNDKNLADYWKEVFIAYATTRGDNSYAFLTSEDGYPLIIDVGQYDPEDQSYTTCNALLRPNTSSSREYLYNIHYQNAKAEKYKELGAVRHHIMVDEGPMFEFFERMKDAGAQKESLVDWANQTVESITVPYVLKEGGGRALPTIDGSGVPDLDEEEIVVAEYSCDYKKLSMDLL